MIIEPMYCYITEVNIALNKPVSVNSGASLAARAVDGNNDPDYFKGSCSHSSEEGQY